MKYFLIWAAVVFLFVCFGALVDKPCEFGNSYLVHNGPVWAICGAMAGYLVVLREAWNDSDPQESTQSKL